MLKIALICLDRFGCAWCHFLSDLATLPDDVLLPDITCIAWYDLNKQFIYRYLPSFLL